MAEDLAAAQSFNHKISGENTRRLAGLVIQATGIVEI